jgi:DNA (cytosine-5)-methyltransferase 1
MPLVFARLVHQLNSRNPVDFFVMENVVGLTHQRHRRMLRGATRLLRRAGFEVEQAILDAVDYHTPQTRRRLFLVGFNKTKFCGRRWSPPPAYEGPRLTVRDAIGGLLEPVHYAAGLASDHFPVHPNHWCMVPKSPKFRRIGALTAGDFKSRSFKTLAWDKPSIAVAYGHREVHIHPEGARRLSVYEAMRLQGFPASYRLKGNLSSQIRQVSEAVPVPLAKAVAKSVAAQLALAASSSVIQLHRPNGKISEPLPPGLKVVAR